MNWAAPPKSESDISVSLLSSRIKIFSDVRGRRCDNILGLRISTTDSQSSRLVFYTTCHYIYLHLDVQSLFVDLGN
jgi:hypothetical protein